MGFLRQIVSDARAVNPMTAETGAGTGRDAADGLSGYRVETGMPLQGREPLVNNDPAAFPDEQVPAGGRPSGPAHKREPEPMMLQIEAISDDAGEDATVMTGESTVSDKAASASAMIFEVSGKDKNIRTPDRNEAAEIPALLNGDKPVTENSEDLITSATADEGKRPQISMHGSGVIPETHELSHETVLSHDHASPEFREAGKSGDTPMAAVGRTESRSFLKAVSEVSKTAEQTDGLTGRGTVPSEDERYGGGIADPGSENMSRQRGAREDKPGRIFSSLQRRESSPFDKRRESNSGSEAGKVAGSAPRVIIGQIDVIVEAPEPAVKGQARQEQTRSLSSRYFIRVP